MTTKAKRKPLSQVLSKPKSQPATARRSPTSPAKARAALGAAAGAQSSKAAIGANTDRADRAGKVNVTGYFDPAVRVSIRRIQVERPDLTQQAILAEALNLVFAKYGVPETAHVDAS